jgi:3' terminal RNA ribose 2'-O-methyltransferase Hen1
MLLTLSTTRSPATDLGYLLHKNPARVQSFELSFGKAHVFYPQAGERLCTAALLLDVDPVWLVRGRKGPSGEAGTLDQYVNDRPYVASSLMSVAIAQVFGTALAGRSKERPELVETAMPLEARISVLPCRGGEDFLRRLFEPLGYQLQAVRHSLDPTWPDWGESAYYTVTLRATKTVHDFLTHLYVLIPVLDNGKHYWVGQDEVDKLLRHGEGWLADHPEREAIAQRYLKHQPSLARQAISRLIQEETPDADDQAEAATVEEETVERPLSLNEQRTAAVLAVLRQCDARRVVDLGCGEGRLLRTLLADKQFEEIVGLDVSCRSLENASDRLSRWCGTGVSSVVSCGTGFQPVGQGGRVSCPSRLKLLHGSLTYRDQRISGFDAATVIEVIEHLDPPRLAAFERVLFEFARPKTVILTTPNREYNAKWPTLPAGAMRHRDHRFEWTRVEFADWARGIAERFGYAVRFLSIGPDEANVGSPTQMGVFSLELEPSF